MKIQFKNDISLNGIYGKVHDVSEQVANSLIATGRATHYKEVENADSKPKEKLESKSIKGEDK